MSDNIKKKKIKKILKKYNYWRKSLGLSFHLQRKLSMGSNCQVACHSDPCKADPTCDFD